MSQYNEGIRTFKAGEALAVYRRVKLNSSQEVVYADADDVGIGTTEAAAGSGEHVAVRLHNQSGTRKVVSAAAVDAGDILYGADDGKVNDVQTVGRGLYEALGASTADGGIVEAIPLSPLREGLLFANIADSAEVENTTDETFFDKKKTIDGNTLQIGDVLEIIGKVRVIDNNSTDTLTLKAYLGTEVIATGPAVDVADGDLGYFHLFVTVRDIGASGKLSVAGVAALGVPGTATARVVGSDEVTEDTTVDMDIKLSGTWSVAHADNEALLEDLIVIHHRQ